MRKWLTTGALLFALQALSPIGARAQGIAFSAPQTISTTPFSGTSCTGSQQVALIANESQTEHYLTVTTSGVAAFRATVQGSHDGVTFNDISDVVTLSGSTAMGQGYYPIVQVSVTCATASGTFTVKYSGQATAPAMQIAALQSSQIDKTIGVGVAAGSAFTSQSIRTPFGNSGGAITFSYAAGGPAGSTLNVGCNTLALAVSNVVVSFPLATSTGPQYFPVAPLPCDFLTVFYNAGGASATTWTSSYVFNSIPISGGDPCQGSTVPKQSVAINTTGTQQLVAGLASHKVYVCGYNFTIAGSATATAQLEFGTNASCAAGTTALSGTWLGNTVPIPILAGGGYTVTTVPSGDFLCIVAAGGTPSVQGILTFIQQ